MDWGFGISRYKLLYIEWINNKVLLYSTEIYIQYHVINHNGKEYEFYIYAMENSSAIKKNEIRPFVATWMDLEIIILSEVSQKERNTNLSTKQT